MFDELYADTELGYKSLLFFLFFFKRLVSNFAEEHRTRIALYFVLYSREGQARFM